MIIGNRNQNANLVETEDTIGFLCLVRDRNFAGLMDFESVLAEKYGYEMSRLHISNCMALLDNDSSYWLLDQWIRQAQNASNIVVDHRQVIDVVDTHRPKGAVILCS